MIASVSIEHLWVRSDSVRQILTERIRRWWRGGEVLLPLAFTSDMMPPLTGDPDTDATLLELYFRPNRYE